MRRGVLDRGLDTGFRSKLELVKNNVTLKCIVILTHCCAPNCFVMANRISRFRSLTIKGYSEAQPSRLPFFSMESNPRAG